MLKLIELLYVNVLPMYHLLPWHFPVQYICLCSLQKLSTHYGSKQVEHSSQQGLNANLKWNGCRRVHSRNVYLNECRKMWIRDGTKDCTNEESPCSLHIIRRAYSWSTRHEATVSARFKSGEQYEAWDPNKDVNQSSWDHH
jgi:hypothetical protein